jgi:peptidoglycan hydrolase CwlO-like protein
MIYQLGSGTVSVESIEDLKEFIDAEVYEILETMMDTKDSELNDFEKRVNELEREIESKQATLTTINQKCTMFIKQIDGITSRFDDIRGLAWEEN